MRRGIIRWTLPPMAALFLALGLATTVLAADPTALELQAPRQASLGDTVTITAVLRDARGAPIPRATVMFWNEAHFLGKAGVLRLGETVTDAQGKATFSYEARTEGDMALNAYFAGDAKYAGAQGSVTLAVQGSAQLYQETVGVQVPGIGVWLLAGILGGIWSIYFGVMVLLALIRREGSAGAAKADRAGA